MRISFSLGTVRTPPRHMTSISPKSTETHAITPVFLGDNDPNHHGSQTLSNVLMHPHTSANLTGRNKEAKTETPWTHAKTDPRSASSVDGYLSITRRKCCRLGGCSRL